MEKFQKSPSGMLQKMKDMEEFCDVTLISDDDKRFRAHKVVLASASTLFKDMFQNYDEETEYQVIHMRGVSSKLIAAMIDLVYDGKTKVEEKECDEGFTCQWVFLVTATQASQGSDENWLVFIMWSNKKEKKQNISFF